MITVPPASQSVGQGQSVEFRVVAEGFRLRPTNGGSRGAAAGGDQCDLDIESRAAGAGGGLQCGGGELCRGRTSAEAVLTVMGAAEPPQLAEAQVQSNGLFSFVCWEHRHNSMSLKRPRIYWSGCRSSPTVPSKGRSSLSIRPRSLCPSAFIAPRRGNNPKKSNSTADKRR